jgi:hypothetical protein
MAESQKDLEEKILAKVAAIDWRKWKVSKDDESAYNTRLGSLKISINRDDSELSTDYELRIRDKLGFGEEMYLRDLDYPQIFDIYRNIANSINEDDKRINTKRKEYFLKKLRKTFEK